MIIKEYSDDYKRELLNALELTKDLSCPPDQYRVLGHTECFHCNECWRYALMNSLPEYTIQANNECVLPNSVIEKLEENLKTLEEVLGVVNSKISDEPIIFNISIDYLGKNNNANKIIEQINEGLRKMDNNIKNI